MLTLGCFTPLGLMLYIPISHDFRNTEIDLSLKHADFELSVLCYMLLGSKDESKLSSMIHTDLSQHTM